MSDAGLRIAVIGHTNTGKTSVLRTLLRDPTLGEVADQAGTTRCNTAHPLSVAGRRFGELWDTPGLEHAAEAMEALRAIEASGLSPADALDVLLDRTPPGLVAEVEPLHALRRCDAGLLVFDARESPKAKHWEEHELLRRCGRPLVAVLNCVAGARAATSDWDAELRRHGLHAIAHFDAWVAEETDAERLFVKLRELLGEKWRGHVDAVIAARRDAERRRTDAMAECLAALVIDAAALRLTCPRWRRGEAESRLPALLAEGWQRLRDALAEIHGVPRATIAGVEAELDSASATAMGPSFEHAALAGGVTAAAAVAGGLAAGAIKGGVLDLATGGATMGLGALIGGAAGLALGGRDLGRHALTAARGEVALAISDQAIFAVAARGCWLVKRLRLYGHASMRPIEPPPGIDAEAPLVRAVRPHARAARTRPSWSSLAAPHAVGRPEASQRAIGRLAGAIAPLLRG